MVTYASSSSGPTTPGNRAQWITQSINSAQDYLLSVQKSAGYWCFDLEADSSLVADYLFLAHYIDKVDLDLQEKSIRWILDTQLEDGGWNIYHGGPSELNITVKCAFAMQLAGVDKTSEAYIKAEECILRLGGLHEVNSYTRFYLGLFGEYPWNQLVSMPPELMFLPTSFYFNIYEISSWSRAIVVPLSIIWARQPIKQPPATVDVSNWWGKRITSKSLRDTFSWRTFFFTIDAIYKRSERFIAPFTRREALRRAENWMLEHMSRGGGLAAIYPAMLNTVIALDCLGYDHDHPTFQNAYDEFMALKVELEDRLWFQPCFSPVWDTGMVVRAFEQSGAPVNHPKVVKAADWLINQEVTIRGDWQIKNPYGPASGWAFEFDNDYYPDTDDTAKILMALNGVRIPDDQRRQACVKRAFDWLLSMQSSDGGWGAFDVDNNKEVLNLIPFADHNALLDPSCADITGRVLEMLGEFGYDQTFSPAARAVKYMRKQQEPDGSWYGRWGVNYIYGTWQALVGFSQIGISPDDPAVKRGVEWLLNYQLEDGGWGETCETYANPSLRGSGPSTPEQTAWAVMGLMGAGYVEHDSVERGINFLLKRQKESGDWDEVEFTGTGFPKVFYLRYTGYRNYFPLMALGQYKELKGF
ncbi:MAG: squalene--hopene cyclase [Candidatus Hinthialibacter antarcticus]|nr:squalene--hopene cyclase [Candidatus Hinthialibacter antarcticus]